MNNAHRLAYRMERLSTPCGVYYIISCLYKICFPPTLCKGGVPVTCDIDTLHVAAARCIPRCRIPNVYQVNTMHCVIGKKLGSIRVVPEILHVFPVANGDYCGRTPTECVCILHIKPFFLPVFFIAYTQCSISVHADCSSIYFKSHNNNNRSILP